MESAIAAMARDFIPAVPSNLLAFDHTYYLPSPNHVLPPDLSFGLRGSTCAAKVTWRPYLVDLDETTSIKEYASTFRSALRLEHEELMRIYEKYSLFQWPLRKHEDDEKMAVIHIAGAADARPSLQISDVVLLRPVQPLIHFPPTTNDSQRYRLGPVECAIEIESRILSIVRGKRDVPDSVIISFDLNPLQIAALNDGTFMRTYAIRFIPGSAFIERSLTALDWMENLSEFQQEALKTVLFPVTAPIVKPLSPDQKKLPTEGGNISHPKSDIEKPLNELQSSFVRMVRARTLDPCFEMTRPPMILTGPAGTGKTKTLIYAIADVLGLLRHGQQYQKKNRVLVCCPSHAASDVLTRRLSSLLKRSEIFRLYHSSRPASTVPGSILPFTCQLPDSDVFTLPKPSEWTGFRVVICTCMDANVLFRAKITNHAIRTKQLYFQRFIMSVSSGGHPLGVTFGQVTVDDSPFFTHLFIDEAAQATEPEILCPLSCVFDPHLGGRKVEISLIGDPRQLSPRVYASNVADSLGRSIVERILRRPVTCLGGGEESLLGPTDQLNSNASSLTDLIRYYANVDGNQLLSVFLTENYRGHPSFLMIPSALFYYDRLRSVSKLIPDNLAFWCDKLRKVEALSIPTTDLIDSPTASLSGKFSQIHRQTTWPIHFRGVMGKDSVAAADSLANFSGTDSWENFKEAMVVVDIVSTLKNEGVLLTQIGVMTPFRGQVAAIRKHLRARHYYDVNVGTIENYQAVEQDVIILSLTRANKELVHHDVKNRMGVFGQPKQVNVAMTRAENLFIVVGDPNVMWDDLCWRQFLRFCLRNGLWYGCGLKQKPEKCDVSYVSTIDIIDKGKMNSHVVVSTLEKIHRFH
ncbi:hypothetical protein ACHAXA_002104 [Cyclostephanos tholiformis]|uniref:RNA helicase n=1 Tax=Cyclostephanos tholiformis TaxID=382380 RepID=A0ABD3SST2_9STRA